MQYSKTDIKPVELVSIHFDSDGSIYVLFSLQKEICSLLKIPWLQIFNGDKWESPNGYWTPTNKTKKFELIGQTTPIFVPSFH